MKKPKEYFLFCPSNGKHHEEKYGRKYEKKQRGDISGHVLLISTKLIC